MRTRLREVLLYITQEPWIIPREIVDLLRNAGLSYANQACSYIMVPMDLWNDSKLIRVWLLPLQ